MFVFIIVSFLFKFSCICCFPRKETYSKCQYHYLPMRVVNPELAWILRISNSRKLVVSLECTYMSEGPLRMGSCSVPRGKCCFGTCSPNLILESMSPGTSNSSPARPRAPTACVLEKTREWRQKDVTRNIPPSTACECCRLCSSANDFIQRQNLVIKGFITIVRVWQDECLRAEMGCHSKHKSNGK